jgi:hypothetical protein
VVVRRPVLIHYAIRWPRRAGKSANALITIGIVLFASSGLEILGNSAHAASRHAEGSRHDNRFATDTSMRVGERISEIAYIGRIFVSQLRL